MDWKQYISGIQFGGLRPEDPGISLLTGHAQNPILSQADLKITTLPCNDADMKARLSELCNIPRMSTFAIGSLINAMVSVLPPGHAFVNVGVWHGFTFLAGLAGNPRTRCIGVDNFSEFGGPRDGFYANFNKHKSDHHQFFEMDYRVYFKEHHTGPIGLYLYDGNHSVENQFEGLKVAEPFFAPGCLLLVDDINEEGPLEGTIRFVQQNKHRYELLVEQHTAHNTHPTFWNGIALLRKAD